MKTAWANHQAESYYYSQVLPGALLDKVYAAIDAMPSNITIHVLLNKRKWQSSFTEIRLNWPLKLERLKSHEVNTSYLAL